MGPALAQVGDASSHPRDLASNPTFVEAVALLASSDVPISVVMDYAAGPNWMPSTVACAALCERSDRNAAVAQMARHFRHLGPWAMHYALQFFTKLDERPPLGSLVLHGPEYWTQHPMVPPILAEHFAARIALGDAPAFGDSLSDASPADLTAAETLLRKINHPAASTLVADLTSWRQKTLDREFLQTFGRIVEGDLDHDLHVEHDGIKEHLAAAEAFVLREPYRSVLVVADARTGKTSFLMLLAARAAAQGWTVFEAGAASLMAGQQVLRAARRAFASALHGACRRKARAVVRPRLPPARRQWDTCLTGRQPPRSGVAGDCCGPNRDGQRDDPRGLDVNPSAPAGPPERGRARAPASADRCRVRQAGARGRRAGLNGRGRCDRSRGDRRGHAPGSPLPRHRPDAWHSVGSPQADGAARGGARPNVDVA